MGEHARRVQERLAEGLEAAIPEADWTVERRVGGTPVDVGGSIGGAEGRLVLVELEWRRADPADNAAKLFRHLAESERGERATVADREVLVVQVFTEFYDLTSGGVSSKRRNATFVGAAAADHLDRIDYRAVELEIDPPKRGGEMPPGWRDAVDDAVPSIVETIER